MLLVRQARDQTVVVVSCFVTLFLRAARRGLGSCHNFPNPEDQFFVRADGGVVWANQREGDGPTTGEEPSDLFSFTCSSYKKPRLANPPGFFYPPFFDPNGSSADAATSHSSSGHRLTVS